MVTDDVFAVIAESTRRDILVSLRSGDKAVGELVEELAASQPTISKHLKVLREAQLVSMRAQGQKRYYALNRKPLEGIASWLETLDVGSAAPAPAAAASPAPAAATEGQQPEAAPAPARKAAAAHKEPATAGAVAAEAVSAGVLAPAGAELSPAVVIPGGTSAPLSDDSVPQQIGRTVGRAATKAADLLANLPKFGRKK
ncbi:winged helix-turn-helix transcriptional regulator [Arthrobacter sp. BB-1]|uniref:ArsR/SmtB family transcription factor n=1 Tax=Micrococcaceae TaxID=1268 RepID=UPI0011128E1D|nr:MULTISPECIES: metalloregulator ArsR/SmtB family transcription factor [Micrococcaceae]TNB70137.1 winged helix-turn-helix transcriptional regulator [Arthrobacter sp. BB-1]UEL27935.1 metalloregulator ArsR/SmtB family transcription factor [Pseudarthrobacter sp. L1SW]